MRNTKQESDDDLAKLSKGNELKKMKLILEQEFISSEPSVSKTIDPFLKK